MFKAQPKSFARSTDLRRLLGVLAPLQGKACSKVELSYGGELRLHFGKLHASTQAKLKGVEQGEWILGTCGTAWRVYTPKGWMTSKTEQEYLWEKKLGLLLIHGTVADFGLLLPNHDLSLGLSNDCEFQITPGSREKNDDVPFWELFTPNHMFVALQSDGSWSYKRSDLPMRPVSE